MSDHKGNPNTANLPVFAYRYLYSCSPTNPITNAIFNAGPKITDHGAQPLFTTLIDRKQSQLFGLDFYHFGNINTIMGILGVCR